MKKKIRFKVEPQIFAKETELGHHITVFGVLDSTQGVKTSTHCNAIQKGIAFLELEGAEFSSLSCTPTLVPSSIPTLVVVSASAARKEEHSRF